MVAAFQLNLFNTSAIEGEIARIERVHAEKDAIKALITKAHSTLTTLSALMGGIQNATLRETLQSAIAQELSRLFPQEVATEPAISHNDTQKSLAVRAAAKLVPYFLNRQAIPKGSASRCANKTLSRVMTEVSGSTDAEGAWIWKDAYDAVEAALVMFIRQEGKELSSQEGTLKAIEQLNWLCPTHTRRSEEAIALQQFSTPLPMAYIASVAAQITASDIVLEPSAGTGLLAVWAEIQQAKLILNEIAPRRREILQALFPKATISGHNGEQINDYLDRKLLPTAIIMNPPFSASPKMAKRNEFATWKHITSALARLQPGGRLVTITANWFSPLNPDWRDYFVRIQKTARVAFSAGIAGQAYAKHGTLIETRLTVIDKVPADNPGQFAECYQEVLRIPDLLGYVNLFVPPRAKLGDSETEPATPEKPATFLQTAQEKQGNRGGENYAAPNSIDSLTLLQPAQKEQIARPKVTPKIAVAEGALSATAEDTQTASAEKTTAPQGNFGEIVELQYTTRDWDGSERELSEGIYEPYEPQVLAIKGAAKHPTPLVQSVAMASVAPPQPTYRPLLPKRVIEAGLLSDIQLESVIYAGEAHESYLKGWYRVDGTLDNLTPATEGEEGAVRFRKGAYNGDGTGVGKGRQVSGVILDNWLRGRKKALWISKSDKLLEDARRDWSALGGRSEEIVPLSKFRQGEKVDLAQGIVFTTYATLRTEAKQGKKSRVEQLVEWLGKDFSGVIVFDESHAMANATTEKQERGTKKASLQGVSGLRLQRALPEARVLYVSATGATTVQNLAYMERLGLWNSQDSPFTSREQFLAEIEEAGIAGLEVIARDLKALGLYTSRSLSYEGFDEQGNAVLCQEALRQREELIEQIAMLPPIPSALDQIIQHFGYEQVAEVTGRSQRIVREVKDGSDRLVVQKRSDSANIAETHAFMNGEKHVLVFSGAGATGRSYHADLNAKNQRQRVQYLLEAGWRADEAVQGLGRTHRSNQAQPPLFRPVTTNVKGEKRFIATITKRLDSLGALTKGQRQAGSQGIFRSEDNLESVYVRAALRQLFHAICAGHLSCCSLEEFEADTGLSLTTEEGHQREELPPMSQFLNRLLALPIHRQNGLFEELEWRIASQIEAAIEAGCYEVGVETLKGESFRVIERQIAYTHANGTQTVAVKLERKLKNTILGVEDALNLAQTKQGKFLFNEQSGGVAIAIPTNSQVDENGGIVKRLNLIRPTGNQKMDGEKLARSHWREISEREFVRLWEEKVSETPPFITENLYLITGLLLPIWNRLDSRQMKVYRLQTECGQRLLGRVAYAESIGQILKNLGVEANPASPQEIFEAVLHRKETMPLVYGWKLRLSTVMGNQRLEVVGNLGNREVMWLKSLGCFTEVINWKMRVFVPANEEGVAVIEKICGKAA